ncbi:MAG: UDP-N-acetylmuramoyl-L-alanine--D-glutamate ligase [Cyanobacteriota bacterium]
MKKPWKDQNIVILGLSRTGVATAKYLIKQGAKCLISEARNATDSDKALIEELNALDIDVEMSGNKDQTILGADLIVTSPGIPPDSNLIKLIRENKIQLISEPELSYMETSTPIIAVTGTNGKTTTTNLISKILTDAEYKAPTCGNIGYPIINEINNNNDFLVAEISSFQLEYSPTFKPQIAVFLNYTPDHVDWHGSEEEYKRVKTNFIKGIRAPLWQVLNANDNVLYDIGINTKSDVYWFGKEMPGKCCFILNNAFVVSEKDNVTPVLAIDEIILKGQHNHENIMAAISTARLAGISIESIAESVKNFKSVEHRLEYVTSINGIAFYNDSKATNVDATLCALRAFEDEKIVLIAGGKDKGTDLSVLASEILKRVNAVILIGEATERFAKAFEEAGVKSIYFEKSLDAAVNKAFDLKAGPVVLSPACASYDMFKNFEERGHVFKDIVNSKK